MSTLFSITITTVPINILARNFTFLQYRNIGVRGSSGSDSFNAPSVAWSRQETKKALHVARSIEYDDLR